MVILVRSPVTGEPSAAQNGRGKCYGAKHDCQQFRAKDTEAQAGRLQQQVISTNKAQPAPHMACEYSLLFTNAVTIASGSAEGATRHRFAVKQTERDAARNPRLPCPRSRRNAECHCHFNFNTISTSSRDGGLARHSTSGHGTANGTQHSEVKAPPRLTRAESCTPKRSSRGLHRQSLYWVTSHPRLPSLPPRPLASLAPSRNLFAHHPSFLPPLPPPPPPPFPAPPTLFLPSSPEAKPHHVCPARPEVTGARRL